ncbi:MAG TPA: 2-phosphosulfolactate phosphatase [Bacteroidota bacterium]
MKIDVTFSAVQLDELQLREKNIIVIDVLRSSTTIAVALHNGAREIIPVASIESAVKISGSLFGEVTLRGGERNGRIIDGFNLGNSPKEYSFSTVNGKSIIFCTTNGSVAMYKSRYARNLAIGSFVNVSAVVDYMKEIGNDFLIICAGRANAIGNFSLEDAVCAGMMLHKLDESKGAEIELSDAARASLLLYKYLGRSLPKLLKTCDHGQYLNEIGFAEDLKICGAVDSVPVLPVLSGTVIKLRKEETRQSDLQMAQSEKQPS